MLVTFDNFNDFYFSDKIKIFSEFYCTSKHTEYMLCLVDCVVELASRSSQEQQQMAEAAMAARDNMALCQIYQRYAHDPALLQRQLTAYLTKSHQDSDMARVTDASHLVYHFASKNTTSTGTVWWSVIRVVIEVHVWH